MFIIVIPYDKYRNVCPHQFCFSVEAPLSRHDDEPPRLQRGDKSFDLLSVRRAGFVRLVVDDLDDAENGKAPSVGNLQAR
jgi:hypothetical protein